MPDRTELPTAPPTVALAPASEMIAPARRAVLTEAANRLADARRTQTPLADLPPELAPIDLAEAYAIQDLLAESYGEIGGWKVGAPDADAVPVFAPMPAIGIAPGGSTLRAIRYRGVEAEVAFRVGESLPARPGRSYSRDEVLAAIASCHPAIEVLESGLIDPSRVARLTAIADLQMHGAFLYGAPVANWRDIDWSAENVTLAIDGSIRVDRTGSNTAGDLLRLLPWLANEALYRTGGLRQGQWIITGSWTGNTLAEHDSNVDVHFGTAGRVSARFASEQELEKGPPGAPTLSLT